MRRDRRAVRAPDMTSLFDVLFILVFVSLVNVGVNHTAAEEAEAKAKAAESALASAQAAAPSAAPSVSASASASVAPSSAPPPIDLSARSATILVRIESDGTDGVLRAIERDGNVVDVNEPLLVKLDNPDAAYEYRGDRSRDLRICAIVASKLGLAELSHFIVVITTPKSIGDTNLILGAGIERDRVRCADEQKGFAVLAPGSAAPGSAKTPGDSP